MNDIRERMISLTQRTQEAICSAACRVDPAAEFREDRWQRDGGGGGTSRVVQDSAVFDKAGANVSTVHGTLSAQAAASLGGDSSLADRALDFWATGVSTVVHPHNPHAPTAHANFRYFERLEGDEVVAWWFGGGADLTPSYLVEADARHFHRSFATACDAHDPGYYNRFKKWCDEYFVIAHRGEARGVGGIFFDHLTGPEPEPLLRFVEACADAFVPAYFPIVEERYQTPFDDRQKEWQQVRRGRYVEFNLVDDRGTTFGLRTAGRIESVLMSLPLTARWEYGYDVADGSPEAALTEVLRNPVDWI